MLTDAHQLLEERVRQLDAPPYMADDAHAYDHYLAHATRIMSSYTNTFPANARDGLRIDPSQADEIVSTSRLLTELSRGQQGIISGPLNRDHQHWLATGRNSTRPAVDCFSEPIPSTVVPEIKPHDFGMYTSTSATSTGLSMWRLYIDPYFHSDLYPSPWSTWRMRVDDKARILDIASARSWADFVLSYPIEYNDLLYPDWASAARHIDGVHITFSAIAATQSLRLRSERKSVATAYWDVESTFWLRWPFTEISLVETIS
jgi:hypothetical protein